MTQPLLAAVVQWLRSCAAEPKGVGSIPPTAAAIEIAVKNENACVCFGAH